MTREEAIRALIRLKDRINWEVTDSQLKMDALNMAIEALKAEPCEDAICRKELLNRLDESGIYGYFEQKWMEDKLKEVIESILSVTPTQKIGRWEWNQFDDGEVVRCSECKEYYTHERKYCPNCGAKMVEPQESEDKE